MRSKEEIEKKLAQFRSTICELQKKVNEGGSNDRVQTLVLQKRMLSRDIEALEWVLEGDK